MSWVSFRTEKQISRKMIVNDIQLSCQMKFFTDTDIFIRKISAILITQIGYTGFLRDHSFSTFLNFRKN